MAVHADAPDGWGGLAELATENQRLREQADAATERLFAFLSIESDSAVEETANACPNSPLRYAKRDGTPLIYRPPCRRWTCPVCGPQQRDAWLARLAAKLPFGRVHVGLVNDLGWKRLTDRARTRRDQDHGLWSVPTPTGRFYVTTDPAEGQPAARDDVLDIARRALSVLMTSGGAERHPSFAGSWRRAEAKAHVIRDLELLGRKFATRWEDGGVLRANDVGYVRKVAARLGIALTAAGPCQWELTGSTPGTLTLLLRELGFETTDQWAARMCERRAEARFAADRATHWWRDVAA